MRPGSPLYGHPLIPLGLVFVPTNQIGVVYPFGMLARELGFVVLRMQAKFPGCEVMRLVDGDRWQRLLVEFEYQSRNFLLHMHDPKQCGVVVCWEHNWAECSL